MKRDHCAITSCLFNSLAALTDSKDPHDELPLPYIIPITIIMIITCDDDGYYLTFLTRRFQTCAKDGRVLFL